MWSVQMQLRLAAVIIAACTGLTTVRTAYAEETTIMHPAITPVPQAEPWWAKRFKETCTRAKQGNVDLVFVGDSITQGWEDVGKATWEKYYGHRGALNLGFAGDQTQHVLWRLDHGNIDGISPKVAVVLIGTNNANENDFTAQQIAEGIVAVVGRIRDKLPATKVLLLAILPRGEKPDASRAKVAEASMLASRLAGGKRVHYLDVGGQFLNVDQSISAGMMPDFLHLSPAGYETWARAIEPKLAELLGEGPATRQQDDLGQTVLLSMKNAPYPHESRGHGFRRKGKHYPRDPHYTDSTVALFVPKGFRPRKQVDLLVYFHGHQSNVRDALDRFRLREQVVASKKNIILVFPQGPKDASDSGGGKLEDRDGLQRLVAEVVDALAADGKITGKELGRVVLAGHSGAYRVISYCLDEGGLEENVRDVCLLDATYARLEVFATWLARHKNGRLLSIFTEHLADENANLMKQLATLGVDYARLNDVEATEAEVAKHRVVFLGTEQLNHNQTVNWLESWLRTTSLPDR